MTDNSLLGGRYSTVPAQAEITRKVQFDTIEARQRRVNAEDATLANRCYPGGNDNNNLKVYPGELVFGRRKAHKYSPYVGRPSELGWTGFAGFDWEHHTSREAMMNDIYFIGIAKTEYAYGKDNFMYDDPLDHGFAAICAGSYTTNNWSNEQIYAGDYLVWDLPPSHGNLQTTHFQKLHGAGTPHGKPLAFLRPLRAADMRFQVEALNSILSTADTQNVSTPGVKNLTADDLQGDNSKLLSPLQEQALGLRVALTALTGRVDLVDRLKKGTLEGDDTKPIQTLYDAVLHSVMCQMSRVVGIAMDASAPGQSLNVVLSHYKIC